MSLRKIELLAPAKNREYGIAAINCGADAVYIGAGRFSARSAAGNATGDIARLADYAHRFNSRVYAAFNTILFDHELDEARKLIYELYSAGVDALIIQDMGILEMDLPPVPLHASTQAENSDPERIKFLDAAGFKRIVLAREMNIDLIREIRQRVSCELEFFIHGALCVSYSGNCYLSAASGGRSANRGECAQPCRKEWTLEDNSGRIISRGHLLSTKDLNHTLNIPGLIDAGIDSLKIEGRLKDIHYVKNITAHYRRVIDRAIEDRPGIGRSSSGTTFPGFTPDPERTFNRGYTQYFLHGRSAPVSSFRSPKFTGKETASVTAVEGNSFTIDSDEPLHNGDGLTFTDTAGVIRGIKVNRAEGNRIFPLDMNSIYAGALLYRNHDTAFEKELDASRNGRKIFVDIELVAEAESVNLLLTDEDGYRVSVDAPLSGEHPVSSTSPEEGIMRHLKKLGATIFMPRNILITGAQNVYIKPSILNDMRRRGTAILEQKRAAEYSYTRKEFEKTSHPYPVDELDFTCNVSNILARRFYERHGVKTIQPAFELNPSAINGPLMKTKLCLKYEAGICPVYHTNSAATGALFLTDGKNRYRLDFRCSDCVMLVYKADKKY